MLDTETVTRRAWQTAALGCGTEIDDDLYSDFIGLNARDSDTLLQAVFGDEFPLIRFHQLATGSFDRYIAAYGIPLKPGLLELLNSLDDHGYPRAVGTSSDYRSAVHLLDLAGVLPRVPLVVAGDQVHAGKPEPYIFLRAAQFLGIHPSDCLVLEDSAPGIIAALAAGMTPILVPDLTPPTPEIAAQAFAIVNSLQDVLPYLQEFAKCKA